jgi:hypothetical protein
MFGEKQLQQWWDRLTDAQHAQLKAAAEHQLDDATKQLMIDTRCPVGPFGTAWESDPFSWNWAEPTREFVLNA